jgi:hypothetical protein
MKTSQLIKLLQEADPNDECIVCINNHPVNDVARMAYYYDGRLEHIERDENNNPIKVGYNLGGQKIKILYDTIEDALMDNPNVELELSGITYEGQVNERYMSFINECKSEGLEFQEWKRLLEESHKNGTPPPPFVPAKPLSLRDKLRNWLKSIGLLK